MRLRSLLRKLVLGLLLLLPVRAWAGNTEASTTTLTIDPSAAGGTTITASDVNDRSNDTSTWANAHVHSLANTTRIGDGVAGTKDLCFDAADATDMCIRFDDTNNMLLIDSPVAGTFGQIVKATGTAGLTVGGVLVGGGTGEITALAEMTNGQLLIGDGSGAPTVATLTQGTGVTITNGAGSITISGASDISARVNNSASISLTDATLTTLTFDSERFDTDTIHSTASNTGRLTATTAGKYLINCQVDWAVNATGRREMVLRLSGGAYIGIAAMDSAGASGALADSQFVTTYYQLAATDYVECLARQNSGGALNAGTNSNAGLEFMMVKVP